MKKLLIVLLLAFISHNGYSIVDDMTCINSEESVEINFFFSSGTVDFNGKTVFTTGKNGRHRDLEYPQFSESSGLNELPKVDVSLENLTENYRIVTTRAHYDGEMVKTFPKGIIEMKRIDGSAFDEGKGYTLSFDKKVLNVEVSCTWIRGMLDD